MRVRLSTALVVALFLGGSVLGGAPVPSASAAIGDLAVNQSLEAPTNVCATGAAGQVTLSWDNASDPNVVGHVAQFRQVGAVDWTDAPSITDPTSASISVVDSLQYSYRVAALSAANERSDWGAYCLIGSGDIFGNSIGTKVGGGGVLDGHAASSLSIGGTSAESGGHACVTDEQGLVACWGQNLVGPLGDGTYTSRSAPVRTVDATTVPLANATQVVSGRGHSCALFGAGAVACWGIDNYGQLGFDVAPDGAPVKRTSIPQVVDAGALSGATVVSLAAGDFSTCAVRGDGGIACWGNQYGIIPVAVTGGALDGRTATAVAVGETFSCALLDNGRVACWDASFATTPPTDRTDGAFTGKIVADIGAGGGRVCGISTEGSGACWGGMSGHPTSIMTGVLAGESLTEIQVAGGLSAGQVCVIASQGRVACGTDTFRFLTGGAFNGAGVTSLATGPAAVMGQWNGTLRTGEPPRPPAITAVEANLRKVTLSWTAAIAGTSPLIGYRIESSADGGNTWQVAADVGLVTTADVTVPTDGLWRFRLNASTAAGDSDYSYSGELQIIVDPRTTKSNVTVIFKSPDGRPLVGSTISWRTSDAILSGVTPVSTSSTGAAVFPVLATGSVVFTASGGSVGTSPVRLETARFTRIIIKGSTSYIVMAPPLPGTITRTVNVQMPDGNPVPDTALTISGAISGNASTSSGADSASWTVGGWNSNTTSGPSGQRVLTGFPSPSIGADVTATFSDGFIQQVANASLTDATTNIVFEQMPVVRIITPEPSPLDPGSGATLIVEAVDGSGAPIAGQSVALSSPSISPKLAPTAQRLALVEAVASCTPMLSGTTGSTGRATFKICPTATKDWRADGSSLVASKPLKVRVKSAPTAVTAGDNHTCARIGDGTARCWGNNAYGQLGTGTVAASTLPVAVNGLIGVTQIAAGGTFTCAIVGTSNTVKCWGLNTSGQLGDGTTVRRTTPVTVTTTGTAPLTGAGRLATGGNFACAVISPGTAGTARCWGANTYSQLGNGSTVNQTRPVTVKASSTARLLGVNRITAGNSFACALMMTGAVRCWGLNNFGQLGNGTTTNSRYPVTVVGIDGTKAKATAIAAGNGYACARMTNGTVRCWGRNDLGQLANGTSTASKTPVTAKATSTTNLTGVTVVVAGGGHACAVTGSGNTARARCWGNNTNGQLGDGTVTTRRYAIMTANISAVTALATGGLHTAALFTSAVRPPNMSAAWGRNASGQLGNGTTSNRSTPGTLSKL